jgi:2-keto-3-deoxy-galactonokinase
MAYNVYFDSGTTNTRAYLLQDRVILDTECAQIGSKDSAIQNDSKMLVKELKRIYDGLIGNNGLGDPDIETIYMSGMISSPTGMVEIDHLSTPVNRERLRDGIVTYRERQFFHREVKIVPGIKTIGPNDTPTLDKVEQINNMRGEEIEIIGIINDQEISLPAHSILILPGSHTQVAYLDEGFITNVLSTVTGELYHALLSETILNSSLAGNSEGIDSEMVCKGYEDLINYGFNRAIYIVRTMQMFTDATLSQRRSYLEGVLNGGVLQAISYTAAQTGNEYTCIGAVGSPDQCRILSTIASRYYPAFSFKQILADPSHPFSVKGLLELIQ